MAKISAADRIATLIEQVEAEARKSAIEDVLIELRACLAEGDDLARAIQVIESNF